MPEYASDPERMTKLETQMENVVLVVTRMDTKMDTWQQSFASKELLEEKLKATYREIERISNEQERLEKDKAEREEVKRLEQEKTSYKNNLPFWLSLFVSTASLLYAIWPHK